LSACVTVALGEGPLYPDKLPLDTDNDRSVLNEGITPAVGEIASRRVLTKTGEPLRNGCAEIWQTDTIGSYLRRFRIRSALLKAPSASRLNRASAHCRLPMAAHSVCDTAPPPAATRFNKYSFWA
jgi:protocatechuate 3,4-dioxygenase beta subunit